MEHQFSVGQSVICINDTPRLFPTKIFVTDEMHGLTKGEIYTIKEIYFDDIVSCPCLVLKEIVSPF